MAERSSNRGLMIASVLTDALILVIFLFMPRSGMEEMATAFLLLPLCAFRILLALICLYVALQRRRWGIFVYTVGAMTLLGWLWLVGTELKPTYEPLHQVLRTEARARVREFAEFRQQRAYDRNRSQQQQADPQHAELCDLLTVRQDLQALTEVPSRAVNRPCASYYGEQVSPLLHVIVHTYGPWTGGRLLRPAADESFLAPAADWLLSAGADPDAQDSYGNTPLHYALIFQNEALLDTLLANGACVLISNALNDSPLSTHSSPELNRKIKAAANDPAMLSRCPGTSDQERDPARELIAPGQGPTSDAGLLSALRSGRLELAIEYLQRGASPSAVDREGNSFDAALKNCRDNHLTLVQLLLDAGANINLQNQRGETALHTAVRHCLDAVPFLLANGADPSVADRLGDTVLHHLTSIDPHRLIPLLNQFSAAGADINQKNRSGQTPLIKASYGSATRTGVTQALLEGGANLNLQDAGGNTALHILASRKTDADALLLLQELLDRGAALEIRNRRQQTPLLAAVAQGSPESVRRLIEAGAEVKVRQKRDVPMISSLISCDPQKQRKLALLVAAGAEVNQSIEHGALPLAQAFFNRTFLDCLEPARLLLSAGARPDLRDGNGSAGIHAIATWADKDPDAALALLAEHGATIDLRNQQGMTTLLLAARYGTSVRTLQRLLEHGADARARDNQGNTLLHCAAMNSKAGNTERLRWVLANGGDPAATNEAGETPLDRARTTRNQPMIEALSALTPTAP